MSFWPHRFSIDIWCEHFTWATHGWQKGEADRRRVNFQHFNCIVQTWQWTSSFSFLFLSSNTYSTSKISQVYAQWFFSFFSCNWGENLNPYSTLCFSWVILNCYCDFCLLYVRRQSHFVMGMSEWMMLSNNRISILTQFWQYVSHYFLMLFFFWRSTFAPDTHLSSLLSEFRASSH